MISLIPACTVLLGVVHDFVYEGVIVRAADATVQGKAIEQAMPVIEILLRPLSMSASCAAIA